MKSNRTPIREGRALEPRDAILRMAPYSPPTAGRQGLLRLDFNENTLGCSPKVREYLQGILSADGLAIYPEYEQARPKIAEFFGASVQELLLTNGTDEAIQVLVNTYAEDGDEVLLPQPSYAMYRFYAEVAGAEIREVAYRGKDLQFPLEELLTQITPRTRLIAIANPNNPTGTGIPLDVVELILQNAPGVALLVDEAYFEFSGITALPLINRYPNLFVSRTFSKVYGLAALRIGCLFSQPNNIEFLRKGQSPYSVNSIAAAAAAEAVADQTYITRYVGEVLAARELLYVGLERLQIEYVKSQGNFVLVYAGERAPEVCSGLRERGILVRSRSHEIPGAVRITVGTREQISRLLEAMEDFW